MKKTLILIAAAISAMAIAATSADAEQGHFRARGTTASGTGVIAGGARNGNAYVRGHGVHQNSDGSVTAASGGAFRLSNGTYGGRASTTTVNPDGSATHQGGFATSGANGSVQSSGNASRTSDGTWSGSRETSATGANGNTYSGSTTYSNGSYSHSASCHDASGAEIACPGR